MDVLNSLSQAFWPPEDALYMGRTWGMSGSACFALVKLGGAIWCVWYLDMEGSGFFW